MKYILANNATATLSALLTVAATSATLDNISATLATALGQVDANNRILLTLTDAAETVHEIVEVTAWNSGTSTATITRAQDGTTAAEWAAGSVADIRAGAAQLRGLHNAHVIGPDDPQMVVTCGPGGVFAHIDEALTHLAQWRAYGARHPSTSQNEDFTPQGRVLLLSGFVMSRPVSIPPGVDMGWIEVAGRYHTDHGLETTPCVQTTDGLDMIVVMAGGNGPTFRQVVLEPTVEWAGTSGYAFRIYQGAKMGLHSCGAEGMRGMLVQGGHVRMSAPRFDNCANTLYATLCATVSIEGGTLTNGQDGPTLDAEMGSKVTLNGTDMTGNMAPSIQAATGATVVVGPNVDCRHDGATEEPSNITVWQGGIITVHPLAHGGFSQTANTVTADGIILA